MDKGMYFSNVVSKGDMLFQKVLAFCVNIINICNSHQTWALEVKVCV
jgi:hypothetical protein